MERRIIALISGITALAFPGAAASGPEFVEQAQVIEAQPVYESIGVSYPATECRIERVTRNYRRRGAYAAPITGGIVGGVLGNRLGRGRGETALTVAGALLGATLGHEYQASHSRQRPVVEHVRRCKTVHRRKQQQQLAGYRVKYRYDGHIFHTQTIEHPGEHIPVRIAVSPASGF